MRLLVVNADDFGFTRDVNEGIVEAHERGILTATTLMANGAAFAHAVELAHAHPSLDIGCHLVLVGGESVAEPGVPLPASVPRLMARVAARRLDMYAELGAQLRRLLDAGLEPTHLDTHKHTHLFPPVLDAVARLSWEFGVRWVRRPFDLPMGWTGVPWLVRTAGRGMDFARRRFHDVLSRHGCLTTDHFAGFQLTGRFGEAELMDMIRRLPVGTTELMCHPGKLGAELHAARTRLKRSRQRELDALVSPRVREALETHGVRLVSYRELGAGQPAGA